MISSGAISLEKKEIFFLFSFFSGFFFRFGPAVVGTYWWYFGVLGIFFFFK